MLERLFMDGMLERIGFYWNLIVLSVENIIINFSTQWAHTSKPN